MYNKITLGSRFPINLNNFPFQIYGSVTIPNHISKCFQINALLTFAMRYDGYESRSRLTFGIEVLVAHFWQCQHLSVANSVLQVHFDAKTVKIAHHCIN